MIVVTVTRVDDLDAFAAGVAAVLAVDGVGGLSHPPFTWALPTDGTVQLSTWAQIRDLMGDDRFALLMPEVALDVREGNFVGADGTLTTAQVPEAER